MLQPRVWIKDEKRIVFVESVDYDFMFFNRGDK